MNVQLPSERMTVEQYLDWCALQPNGRFELQEGRVVMMTPERVRHVHVKTHAWLALRMAIERAGATCTAFGDGVSVRIDNETVREPDASVQCTPVDPDGVFLDQPIVLVEVLSPSSEDSDTGAKLAEYFSLDSVCHYLILDPVKRIVVHHRREQAGDTIATRIVREGTIELSPPGITVVLAELFGEADQ